VHSWWAPVDLSVKSRFPQRLEAALREAHGAEYLRTIRLVRHGDGLHSSDRHALEVEMSSRLVRARAMLGKWKAGMDEIRAAVRSRDVEGLGAALSKWEFSEEDEEIAGAKADLERWQRLAQSLPAVLREALDRRDVEAIRETMAELSSGGPAGIEGSAEAERILARYDLQARSIDDAIAKGSAKAIQIALQTWEFDREDAHPTKARNALDRRRQQKVALRAAVESMDGPRLQYAVEDWDFERHDEDFTAAAILLNRYAAAARELYRLARDQDLAGLGSALATWEFVQDDPAISVAKGCIESHKAAAREALEARDGWALHRIWLQGGNGRGLAADGNLREESAMLLQGYTEYVTELRRVLRGAETFGSGIAAVVEEQVKGWPFYKEDPHLQAGRAWLVIRMAMSERRLDALKAATEGGSASSVRGALQRCHVARPGRLEVQRGEELLANFDAALNAVGRLVLGADSDEQQAVTEHLSGAKAEAAKSVCKVVDSMDARWFVDLKNMSKPSRAVHGVFEMLMHALVGVNKDVKDPPKDTQWRSCQRMFSSGGASFLSNLSDVPNWVASGHKAGIQRARALEADLKEQLGPLFTMDNIRAKSAVAGHLYTYLELLFAFCDALEDKRQGKVSLPAGKVEPASLVESSSTSSTAATSRPSPSPRPTVLRSQTEHLGKGSASGDSPSSRPRPTLIINQKAFLMLHRARCSIGGSAVLSSAWMAGGGDDAELELYLKRARRHAISARAVATVAQQVILTTCDLDQDELRNRQPTRSSLSTPRGPTSPTRSRTRTSSNRFTPPPKVSLKVKLTSGEVIAEVEVDDGASVLELKAEVEREEGTPAALQRLIMSMKVLPNDRRFYERDSGESVTLIRSKSSLPRLLEAALATVTAANPSELEVQGGIRPGSEPAAYLLYGVSGDGLASAPPRRGPVHAGMVEVLKAAMEVLDCRGIASDIGEPGEVASWALRLSTDFMPLNRSAVRTLRVPQLNIAAAKRSLNSLGTAVPPAVRVFVDAMEAFYVDFPPQRAVEAAANACAEEAEEALRQAEEVVKFTRTLVNMDERRNCYDAEGVEEEAERAMTQLQLLSEHGLALPALHVEYVRQAIDSAGETLLASPPAADPGARLRWAEAAMAIQLAPLRHFDAALQGIARGLDMHKLEALARLGSTAPPPCVRLLAAVVWVVDSNCRSDANWAAARERLLLSPVAFVERLATWRLVKDASSARLSRAREVLLEIWGWVADGCGGNHTLCVLFAWVSLAVALRPVVEISQRLLPVHRAVKKGIARSARSEPKQSTFVTAKAWTTALFLLDGPGEEWWWLQLIRPAATWEPPWMDGDDGGVGEAILDLADNEADEEKVFDNEDALDVGSPLGSSCGLDGETSNPNRELLGDHGNLPLDQNESDEATAAEATAAEPEAATSMDAAEQDDALAAAAGGVEVVEVEEGEKLLAEEAQDPSKPVDVETAATQAQVEDSEALTEGTAVETNEAAEETPTGAMAEEADAAKEAAEEGA